ncbi:hypothetical protein SCUCBS95973_009869 [Sporothrix curviconia]|uniref:Aminoglycoside phosphotransferase domain-containing protein n=1 Tax=Sporothrix curviconia TaxID=1260050 RepID=A0ABP0D068_9PEZI
MGQSIGTLFPLWLRLWVSRRLFRPLGYKTYRLSWHRVVKGPCDAPEVEAMRFIASNTTIPIPRLYAVHVYRRALYIEMEYVPGDTLGLAWDGLSTAARDTVFADLKEYIDRLRRLEPPAEGFVSSAFQNPAYDGRIGCRFFGPCTHDDFHSLTRGHLRKEDVAPFLGPDVEHTHTTRYRTCFTHADLAPRNIIVREGRVAAIVDWAYSGWYPEYWEFTKAHYNYVSEDWEEYLRIAMPCYDQELAGERVLWRRLPEPGTKASSYREGVRIHRPGSSPPSSWLDHRAECQCADLWSVTFPEQ